MPARALSAARLALSAAADALTPPTCKPEMSRFLVTTATWMCTLPMPTVTAGDE
jgi:hypothetical protein